jgi:hypothetical protein
MITADLIGGGMVDFRKGSLAIIELHRRTRAGGILDALYLPKALRALA